MSAKSNKGKSKRPFDSAEMMSCHCQIHTNNDGFNWRKWQRYTLYGWTQVLVTELWACHLEVEWASLHCHLHGNEPGLELPNLQAENPIPPLSSGPQQNQENTIITYEETTRMASYFAYKMISVFPPHVSVGGHIHSEGLKWLQRPHAWQDKESCTFSMSQQAANKL